MGTPSVPTEEVVDMSPFKMLVMTIGTLPAAFTESMTYYEALAYFVKYLEEKVVPAVNQNAEATKELQTLFVELKAFVDNYFDNLDVQEEINNKLDEMAASGELEAILQQILNTLRVYDTVTEMIADTSIQDGQRVMTLGYSTVTDNGGGVFTITDSEQTPNGVTIIELDNGLYALREYTDKIVIPDQSVLTPTLIAELLNSSVQIVCDGPIEVTSAITINTEGATIRNMEFEGNLTDTNHILLIKANKVTVDGCKFSGTVPGNYVRCSGINNFTLTNNLFDGTNGSMTSGVVFWSVKHAKIHGNTFIDMDGFNTQFIQSSSIIVSDNTYSNPHFQGSLVTSGGEVNLQFNTGGVNPRRHGLRINGSKTDAYTLTYDSTTSIATITLSSAIQGEKTVIFRCYESLEMINLNSHCNDITITGNTFEGTGDSGIVIGADYHHNVLSPGSVSSEDYPRSITVSNNVIRDCAYAGINIAKACPQVVVTGNVISNCGWISTSDLFCGGIFFPINYRAKGPIISNNVILNSTTATYGETENGITKYGVVINPTGGTYTTDEYNAWLSGEGNSYLHGNRVSTGILLYKTYAFDTAIVQINYGIESKELCILSAKANATTDDNGYHFTTSRCTLATGTDSSMDILSITFNDSGDRYCAIENTIFPTLENCELIIGFWAKANVDGGAAFRVSYRQGSTSKTNAPLLISNKWEYYEYKILVGAIADRSVLQGRFIPIDESDPNLKFRNIQVKVNYYN